MSIWNEHNTCIKAEKKDLDTIKKICECYELDADNYFDVFHANTYACGDFDYFDLDWDLRYSGTGDELFPILAKYFRNIKLCSVYDSGSTSADSVFMEGTLYDSQTNKEYFGTTYFSEGSQLVGDDRMNVHDVLTWDDLKVKIEDSARDKGITVSWVFNNGKREPDYDNDEFFDLCNDIFYEEFSYWDEGTTYFESDLNLSDMVIVKEAVDKIKENAINRGYEYIVELMENINNDGYKGLNGDNDIEKINDVENGESIEKDSLNLIPDCSPNKDIIGIMKEVNKNKKSDKVKKVQCDGMIFVSTGLSAEEERFIQAEVEKRGGIYKPKFVVSLNYLIVNPYYDHVTTKITDAKAQIEKGKDVNIISFDEFKEALGIKG